MQFINGDALQHRGEPCWFRMQATLHSFQREAGAEPRGGRWHLSARPRSAHYWCMGRQRRKSAGGGAADGTPRTFHLSTPLLPQRAPPYFSRIAPTLFTPEAPATSFGKLQLLWCTALTKHCGKRLQAVVEACFAHPPPPRPVYS